MVLMPLSARNFGDNPRGAGPDPFNPVNFPLFASQYMANTSPPMPSIIGSTNPSTAFAAIAASTADPPFARICAAACDASVWLVAAIPCFEITIDRP